MSTLASAGDTAHHMGLGSNAGILDGANAEAMAEELSARFSAAREALSSYVFGQRTVVDQVLITLLSGGNGLLVGVPGLSARRVEAQVAARRDIFLHGAEGAANLRRITDVDAGEIVVRRVRHVAERLQIARVGELI